MKKLFLIIALLMGAIFAGTFEYKVREGDTLQLGGSRTPISMLHTLNVASNATVGGTFAVTKTLAVSGTFSPLGGLVYTYESKTASTTNSASIDPAKYVTIITSSTNKIYTLANGTYNGQVKKVILVVDGGTITLTPANLANGTSLTLADALDSVELIWNTTDWVIASASGIAIVP
jgi:hypothetical protein